MSGKSGEELACFETFAVGDRLPDEVGRRRQEVNIAGPRVEDGPVVGVGIAGPHQVGGSPPGAVGHQQVDNLADAGQLAVPAAAYTVRPFTVASTTGRPASAALRRNARR